MSHEMSSHQNLDTSTWSPKLSELVKSSQVVIMPFDLEIDYDYWTYRMYVGPILLLNIQQLILTR